MMTDKINECTKRHKKEAWTCWHSKTPKYRNHYLWSCMRWMTTEQVARYVNLEQWKY